jgi:hypothetical protein
MFETPRERFSSFTIAPEILGRKGVRLVVWVGRAFARTPGFYFGSAPPNIFIIAACISACRLGYFV